MKHRALTSEEWLEVRAAGNDAYRAKMTRPEDSEEKAGAAADEAREKMLRKVLLRKKPTESKRDRRYNKWIETGDQRWLNRSLSEDPSLDTEDRMFVESDGG